VGCKVFDTHLEWFCGVGPMFIPYCGFFDAREMVDYIEWEIIVTQERPIWYGDYLIRNNTDAENLRGFTEVTGNLSIQCYDSPITLTALDSLISVGGYLMIDNNEWLSTLSGLDNITSVEGNLGIHNNNSLISLGAHSDLYSVGRDFFIRNNSELCTHFAEDLRDQVLTGDGIGGDIYISHNLECDPGSDNSDDGDNAPAEDKSDGDNIDSGDTGGGDSGGGGCFILGIH